ncbi:MAG: hypothetical protein LC754_15035, partial [Acidobacteria bacterium]|nr:hypothetical protein [Acidobacteriota bacterium]
QTDRSLWGNREGTRSVALPLNKLPVSRILHETVMVADVNWYQGIAANGYEKMPFIADNPHNWAFFPLFPLVWRLGASLTGDFVITGMMLSHVFFFFGLFLAHRIALAFGFAERVADRSIYYLAIFPVSYFFSIPLTESFFLLLTTGCIYAAKRGRWWTAGVLGALASATRVTGVLILPALLVLYWQTYGGDWRSKAAWRAAIWRREFLSLCLVPAGIASFMWYLYAITGNPLAFKDILVTWGRGTGFFVVTLYEYLRDPLLVVVPWDFRIINFAGACVALGGGVMLLKWRQWALAAYTLVAVLVALSSLVLQSQARYAMVLFPAFFALAVAGERPRVDDVIRAVSLALLSLMTALFAARFTIAMS